MCFQLFGGEKRSSALDVEFFYGASECTALNKLPAAGQLPHVKIACLPSVF